MLHPIHTFIHRIGRLVLLDRAADPTVAGEIQRNATHVKVYSGGAVRNLSDVGASANHALGSATHTTKAHSELTGVGTGDHHAQLHATAHQPAGADAMAVDAAAATGSLRTLGTTALKAAAGDHTHAGGASKFTLEFISAQQVITSAGALTLAHSLGVKPKLVSMHLICQTAESGYAIGDEVAYDVTGTDAGASRGAVVTIDATNLVIRYGSTVTAFIIINKASGAIEALTNANWKAVWSAWA